VRWILWSPLTSHLIGYPFNIHIYAHVCMCRQFCQFQPRGCKQKMKESLEKFLAAQPYKWAIGNRFEKNFFIDQSYLKVHIKNTICVVHVKTICVLQNKLIYHLFYRLEVHLYASQQYTFTDDFKVTTWNTKTFSFHFISNHQNSHGDHIPRESITSSCTIVNIAQPRNFLIWVIFDLNQKFSEHCIQFFNFLQTQLKQSLSDSIWLRNSFKRH
jgi:hypothetical protein